MKSSRVVARLMPCALALFLGAGMAVGPPPPPALADWDAETAVFLVLINEYRQQNGQGPLAMDAVLQRAADWHSNDLLNTMRCNQQEPVTCGHTDSMGRSAAVRARDGFGFKGPIVGENVAWGITTAKQALESWKASPGHNANMLSAQYKSSGIGRTCPAVGGACMWVQKFSSEVTEPFQAPALTTAQANFNGTWTAKFDQGRVVEGPLTLTQAGEQVTGTLGVNFMVFQPVAPDAGARLTGKVLPGTAKVFGTLVQPASATDPELTGTFEMTLLPNGSISAEWQTAGDEPMFWIMRDAPKAAAGAAPATGPAPAIPPATGPAPATQPDNTTPAAQDPTPPAMEEEPIE